MLALRGGTGSMPRALLPPARRQLKLTACDLFEVVDWLKVMKNLFISNAFATSAAALSAFLISTAAIAKPIKLPTTTVARKTTIIYMTTFPPPEFDKPFTGKVTIWQVNSVDDIQTKYCMAAIHGLAVPCIRSSNLPRLIV